MDVFSNGWITVFIAIRMCPKGCVRPDHFFGSFNRWEFNTNSQHDRRDSTYIILHIAMVTDTFSTIHVYQCTDTFPTKVTWCNFNVLTKIISWQNYHNVESFLVFRRFWEHWPQHDHFETQPAQLDTILKLLRRLHCHSKTARYLALSLCLFLSMLLKSCIIIFNFLKILIQHFCFNLEHLKRFPYCCGEARRGPTKINAF